MEKPTTTRSNHGTLTTDNLEFNPPKALLEPLTSSPNSLYPGQLGSNPDGTYSERFSLRSPSQTPYPPRTTTSHMKEWLPLNDAGDLPPGVHPATLAEVIERFGKSSPQRPTVARRLGRIYSLVRATGHMARFIIFGSFITAKTEPNDVDTFLVMDDDFEVSKVTGEAAILFDHLAAQNYGGASIFWVRRLGALGGEQVAIEDWQIKRDGARRGVVEVNAP